MGDREHDLIGSLDMQGTEYIHTTPTPPTTTPSQVAAPAHFIGILPEIKVGLKLSKWRL